MGLYDQKNNEDINSDMISMLIRINIVMTTIVLRVMTPKKREKKIKRKVA